MAQIFHRSFNFISRLSLSGLVFLAGLGLTGMLVVARSPYITNQRVTPRATRSIQPQTPRGRRRNRLPVLSYQRGDVCLRGNSTDENLHELPFRAL